MNDKINSYGQWWESIIAIIVGLLFVIWPESIIRWAVLFVGIISLIVGAIQLIVYFSTKKKTDNESKRIGIPVLSTLFIIWGLLLLLQQEIWVNLFMIVMSVPMIILAIGQIVSLAKMNRAGFDVRGINYVFPVLFLLAGITVMFNPFASAVWLVFFVGIWTIAYGVIELIYTISMRK